MQPASGTIAEAVGEVQDQIAAACRRAGRSPDAVTLVAVSKQRSAAEIVEAIEAGIRHLGENRLEEALPKIAAVAEQAAEPVSWHMVGHVQSRKARHVLTGFAMLHSLDSVKLAQRLSRFLNERGDTLDVLLEMNVSGEASKAGWDVSNWQHDPAQRSAVWDDIAQITALPGLNIRGMMTMAPIVADPEDARPVFVALRELRDALAADFPAADWSELSMGMTDDFPVAVEEGATIVRIGRAIFGPRSD